MLLNIFDYEREATARMSAEVAAFVNSGDGDELTLLRNRHALDQITLRARRFADISTCLTSTVVLGCPIRVPVLIAPMGLHALAHPDGELAAARAASRARTVMTVSTMSTRPIEEITAAAPDVPVWFQLYHLGRQAAAALVERAEHAGCTAICLTVDAYVRARGREHELRNSFRASKGQRLAQFEPAAGSRPTAETIAAMHAWKRNPLQPVTLEELDFVRNLTRLPLARVPQL